MPMIEYMAVCPAAMASTAALIGASFRSEARGRRTAEPIGRGAMSLGSGRSRSMQAKATNEVAAGTVGAIGGPQLVNLARALTTSSALQDAFARSWFVERAKA